MAIYPDVVFPTSLATEGGVTPLTGVHLDLRDAEIRAIGGSLGIGTVPSTSEPLAGYLKVAEVQADVEHRYLAHGGGPGAMERMVGTVERLSGGAFIEETTANDM
jgi:hypothetical protein